jgi:hypothetical protein
MSVPTNVLTLGRTSKVSDFIDLSDNNLMRRVAQPS